MTEEIKQPKEEVKPAQEPKVEPSKTEPKAKDEVKQSKPKVEKQDKTVHTSPIVGVSKQGVTMFKPGQHPRTLRAKAR